MLVNKPAKAWIDNDVDRIFVESTNFCRNFINLETMSYLKGNEGHSFAFSFISHKKDMQNARIQNQTLSDAELHSAREMIDKLRSDGFSDKKKLTAALAILLEDGE